jgi:hypothetical protein
MEFVVQYTMDQVGYVRILEADSKEKAIVACIDEMKRHYPTSVFEIIGVAGGEEKVEVEKKKKKVKEV